MSMQEQQRSAADEILMQLGGRNRLRVAIGAKDFFSDNNGNTLVFKVGSGAKNGIKHIKIHLNVMDTHDVTFTKIFRKKDKELGISVLDSKEVSNHGNIYADMLKSLIEEETGFYLSPFGA